MTGDIPRAWTVIAMARAGSEDFTSLPRVMSIEEAKLFQASGRLVMRRRSANNTVFLEIMERQP